MKQTLEVTNRVCQISERNQLNKQYKQIQKQSFIKAISGVQKYLQQADKQTKIDK